jgi:hypothetical protein
LIARALVIALMLWSATARADSAVSVRPATLSLGATRGEVLIRDLALTGDAKTLSDPWTIQVVPLSTAQGEEQDVAAIVASAVVEAGSRRVRVTIDVRNSPPGAYAAEVSVSGLAGTIARVPVAVNVKAAPLLPIILLVLGVALGGGLSWYRTNWLDRDEALARIGSLLQRMPEGLPRPFIIAIEQQVAAAKDALGRKTNTDAKAAVGKAEMVLARFLARADEWRVQLAFAGQLADTLSAMPATGTTAHRDGLVRRIEQEVSGAPLAGEVTDLEKALRELRGRIMRYARLDFELAALAGDLQHAAHVETWRALIDRTDVSDDAALNAVEREVTAAVDAVPGAAHDLDAARGVRLPAAPATRTSEIVAGARAGRRGQIAANVALIIGLISLAILGYHELYEDKAVFGGLWAHTTLFFWGIGSELTRGAAAGLLRQGGIPDAAG